MSVATDEATTGTDRKLVRVEFEQPADWKAIDTQAPGAKKHGPVVEDGGDVVFWAVAVDRNKTPNRRGFLFRWKSAEDVEVANLKDNPVLLWRHDDWSLPVGQIERIEVTRTQVWMQCRIWGDVEDLAWLADYVAKGRLRAVSIGFYIGENTEVEVKGQKALEIYDFEIVELSLCTIGAHETALIQQAGATKDAGQAAGTDGDALASHLPDGVRIRWEKETAQDDKHGDRVLYRMSLEAAEGDSSESGVVSPESGASSPEPGASDLQTPDAEPQKPPASWLDAQLEMAKLLGARGGIEGLTDEERQARHVALAPAYRAHGLAPPELREHSSKELKQLHADGVIVIPSQVVSVEQLRCFEEKLLREIETIKAQITESREADQAEVLRQVRAQWTEFMAQVTAERQGGPPDPQAPAAGTTDPLADLSVDQVAEALRPHVRQILADDPQCAAQRQSLVTAVVDEIRRANAPRR